MLLFLRAEGVLEGFNASASHIMGKYYLEPGGIRTLIVSSLRFAFKDGSGAMLLIGLTGLLMLGGWRDSSPAVRRTLVHCLALAILTPLVFNIIGHYAFYYASLQYLPECFAFFTAWSALRASTNAGRKRGVAFGLFATGAVFIGLPLKVALASNYCHITPRTQLQAVVNENVSTNDVAFADDTIFFEVKQRARVVYTRLASQDFLRTRVAGKEFTETEKQAVSVLIIAPELAEKCTNHFGGEWRAATAPFGDTIDWEGLRRVPRVGPKLERYFHQLQNARYPIQIFRRVPPLAEQTPPTPPSSAAP